MPGKNTNQGSGCIEYRAIIIGGGPGGYTCALRLAKLGAKAVVVEEGALGGVCANSGCIPVKALHASAKILREARGAQKHGIDFGELKVDYAEMRKRALSVAQMSAKGIEILLKKNGVDVFKGRGKIETNSVVVGRETLHAENIVIASGSVPIELPGIPFSNNVLSSESLLRLEELPRSLLVVGGGYVGVEYACIFNSLGCRVSLVEMRDRIIPNVDAELTAILQRGMKRDGIDVKLGAKVEKVTGRGAVVNGEEIEAEKILVAVGRRPNFVKEEMDKAGVKCEWGIIVDDAMRTSAKNIYAVGDVVGKMMLAHMASAEGVVAAENMMGRNRRMDYSCVPSCVFSFPEIAVVGSSEPTLKVGRFPFAASGKARAMGETEGMVKVYARDEIIAGAGIIGPHASDLIGEACIAVKNKMKLSDITEAVHPHPVLSEAFVEACLDARGEALNI